MPKKRRPTIEDIYRLSMASAGRTESITPQLRKSVELEQTKILRFMSQKDLPTWFRAMSFFQLQAADDLFSALRDDGEQATTYRVRDCLNRLGITPKVKHTMVWTIMPHARGNDLAFLFFFREMYYKSTGEFYSINEQLLLSTIAHLDLVTTLRELDRILPSPQRVKPHEEPPRPISPVKNLEKAYQCKYRNWKKKGLSPYLEPIPPPRVIQPKPARRPNMEPQFKPYDKYIDPDHVVRNEKNRWFTNYKFQPAKRVVRRLIDEELKTIFDDYEASLLKYSEMTTLCEFHKEAARMEKYRKTQKLINARDNCLKILDTERYHRQYRENRIQAQLNQQVERYRERLRRMVGKPKLLCIKKISNESRCAYLIRENYDIDCIPLETDEYDEEACCDKETRSSGNIEDASSQVPDCNKRKVIDDVHRVLNDEGRDCENCKRCQCFVIPPAAEHCNAAQEQTNKNKARTSVARDSVVTKSTQGSNEQSSDYAKNYKYGHSDASTPPSSKKFFHAPSIDKPFQFDHSKVFYFKQKTDFLRKHDLRSAVAKAVDSEVSNMPWNNFEPVNMNGAVKSYALKIWKEQVRMKIEQQKIEEEAEHQRMLKLDAEEKENEEQRRYMPAKLRALLNKRKLRRKSPLDYHADYYDPDDEDLMVQMLYDAFSYMKKDPKFVLASIPDAHKLPLLRAWIMHRFGKRYNLEELTKSLNESLRILKALEKTIRPIQVPHIKKLARNFKVDYSCFQYVKKKANSMKKEYYNEVYDSLMDSTRIIWFAIQPYLCSKGPPINTFFAYMPARIGQIMPFRPWKKHEFVDAQREWDTRMKREGKK